MFGLSFLNSIFLIFLSSLILPIIIYLITKRKPKKVFFSSVKYIKESVQQRKKKMNLKNILLLLIRLLILLFVIMGISRPVLKKSKMAFTTEHPKTAIAVIIDNSYSMDYLIDTQTDIDKAKDICKRINAKVNNNDVLILITRDKEWNKINSFVNYGKLPDDVISKITVTPKAISIKSAFDKANKLLKESQYINKQIFYITDFQKEKYPKKNAVPFVVIKTSDFKFKKNLACIKSYVITNFTGDKKKKKIHFVIKNYSDISQSDVICRLVIDNKTVSEKVMNFAPFQEKASSFDVLIKKEGWHSGYIKVKNERLEYDNKNYFSFYMKDNPSVAIISSDKEFPLSFTSILEIYTDNISILNPNDMNNLDEYDNIVIYKPELTDKFKDIISHINNKKLLFILDKNDDEATKKFYELLFGIKINDFYDNKQDVAIDKINKFDNITDILKKDEDSKINYFYKIDNLRSTTLLGAGYYPVAIKNDKKWVLWTFSLDIDNPFMVSGMFPVFAYNCFMATNNHYENFTSYKAGDVIKTKGKKVILPDGKMRYVNKGSFVADKIGIYNLFKKLVSVNLDYSESNFKQMSKNKSFVVTYRKWRSYIFKNSIGKDLWKYFFLIALILFVIEMILVKTEERR